MDLPEEILTEIFSRLNAKSVGKCRCLSKTWLSRLSTSQFINLHLSRKTDQENLILIDSTDYSLHTVVPPITDDVVSNKLRLRNTCFTVLGSCNGLVLYASYEGEMFLVNPITQQQVNIPDSTLTLKEHDGLKLYGFRLDWNQGLRAHGFGYDSSTDDYKVVMLSYYVNRDDPIHIYILVEVYYVKLGVWKRIGTSRQNHPIPCMSYGAYVNGSIHWLSSSRGSSYPSMIVAFDLNDEVFREIPAPTNVYDGTFSDDNRLSVLGGCLCMVDSLSSSRINVWMMKEYGLVESWTKFSVEAEGVCDIRVPLCFTGDKEDIVLLSSDKIVVLYNLQKKTTKFMAVDGVVASFFQGGTFVDSLVSPRKPE